METIAEEVPAHKRPAAFGGGVVIGALGGVIGLGGAEFRLPLLISVFPFAALEAVFLNKAMSLCQDCHDEAMSAIRHEQHDRLSPLWGR